YRVDGRGRLHPVCGIVHKNWIIGVAFSPNSKDVASIAVAEGTAGDNDVLKVSSADSCEPTGKFVEIGHAYVQSVAYSPVGDLIAWSTRAGDVWLTDLSSNGMQIPLPKTHSAPVDEMKFSPDGKLLVTAGRDMNVVVWDVTTRSVRRKLPGHTQAVYTIDLAR